MVNEAENAAIAASSTTRIPHPASTRFNDDESYSDIEHGSENETTPVRNIKRRKITATGSPNSTESFQPSPKYSPSSVRKPKFAKNNVDTELDEDGVIIGEDFDSRDKQPTQLETALPPVQTDSEAIEAYDAYQAATRGEQNTEEGGNSDNLETRLRLREWTRGRSSIYVDAFNLALKTVLEDEAHLFDTAEKEVFRYWEELTYEAQYLYVRLFLRKTSAWFRIGKLAYYGDIADMEAAVRDLQVERTLPKPEDMPECFPGEKAIPDEALPLGNTFVFAEGSEENITTLNEASSLLLLDELKTIAKDVKVVGKNKTELLRNLRRTSGKQRGLGFVKRSETEESVGSERAMSIGDVDDDRSGGDATPDGTVTPKSHANRDEYFMRKILDRTGNCIRLSLAPLKLFERVHLVFYRSTEWTEKSLTTLILAKISRRNFPEYIVSRSANIFETRSLLLEFEASLRTQFRVDSILEFNGTPTRPGLEEVRTIFEAVYPRWQSLVAKEQQKEDRVYESGEGAYLRRFSPAWVYTRIIHKALGILAKFKEHLREHGLLCELLQQRLFHAARRGSWYSRKALLEEHYMYLLTPSEGRSDEVNKKHWKRIALLTCEEGLRDNECHVIYHYDLQKRIKKLEKQLRIPKREQHEFGHVGLLKARERTVEGIKIEQDDTPSRSYLRRKSSTSSLSRSLSRERSNMETNDANGVGNNGNTELSAVKRPSTKTIWHDALDTCQPVSVESMCLSHYRKVLGFKGYHSEGGVLRTLFGLLFASVMFEVYVPNVFQTAYQTCPLDLHTDAFYSARISEINHLINRITNGEAEDIIRQTWTQHYERRTCIVGVKWDDYEFEDLIEIIKCWDGEALGVVMRVIAQEYGARGGGVPDLFLWKVHSTDVNARHESHENGTNDENNNDIANTMTDTDSDDGEVETNQQRTEQDLSPRPTTTAGISSNMKMDRITETSQKENEVGLEGHRYRYGKIMFSEVKSENDRLSDTQRLWISVLLNAGVEVELCHAVASEVVRQ